MKKILFNFSLLVLIILISSSVSPAQTQSEQGAEAYRKGNYKEAIKILKKVVKSKTATADDWYFLGASQLNDEKAKDADKSFKSALRIDSKHSRSLIGLGYYYLMHNRNQLAREAAEEVLEINKMDAEAYYILGITKFRDQIFSGAYDDAERAIKINPNLSAAYVLKTESLVNSFAKQSETVLRPDNPRAALLQEASESLEKYSQLVGANNIPEYYRNYLNSLRFFADYYKEKDKNPLPLDPAVPPATPSETGFNIFVKPKPGYTVKAREAGIQGTVKMIVGFSASGKVEHILVTKSLGFGLDEAAVNAARGLKFTPAMRDGKPISTVKFIEYFFGFY